MACWTACSCRFFSLVASVVVGRLLSFLPLWLRKDRTGGPGPSIVCLVFENLALWCHNPCMLLSGRTHGSGRRSLHHKLSPAHQYSVRESGISARSRDGHRGLLPVYSCEVAVQKRINRALGTCYWQRTLFSSSNNFKNWCATDGLTS